jgi:hypothetical protein
VSIRIERIGNDARDGGWVLRSRLVNRRNHRSTRLMNLHRCFRLAVVIVVAGCSRSVPTDAEIYSKDDGKRVGVVIETGKHTFENGLYGPAVHFRKPDGTDIWSSLDSFGDSYEVRPKK